MSIRQRLLVASLLGFVMMAMPIRKPVLALTDSCIEVALNGSYIVRYQASNPANTQTFCLTAYPTDGQQDNVPGYHDSDIWVSIYSAVPLTTIQIINQGSCDYAGVYPNPSQFIGETTASFQLSWNGTNKRSFIDIGRVDIYIEDANGSPVLASAYRYCYGPDDQ